MAISASDQDPGKQSAFERAAEEKSPGIVREFIDFLKTSKKWWLTPIILVLLILGFFVLFGGSAAVAPFIYTLF